VHYGTGRCRREIYGALEDRGGAGDKPARISVSVVEHDEADEL
jgi:hypothetical protein